MWPNRLKPIYLVGVLVIIAMIAAFGCSSDDDADDSSDAAPAAAAKPTSIGLKTPPKVYVKITPGAGSNTVPLAIALIRTMPG